jgi:hypothetical protein
MTPSLYAVWFLTSRCDRNSQDSRTFSIPAMGATLAESAGHFPERTCVPRSSPRNQLPPPPLLSSHDSGMIVFSSSARILYMNGPARTLMALFGKSHELWRRWHRVHALHPHGVLLRRAGTTQRRVEAQDWAHRNAPHLLHGHTLPPAHRVWCANSTNREIRVILTLPPALHSYAVTDSQHLCPPADVQASVRDAIS